MYLAQYAAELIALLFQEHDAHPALFDRLLQTLPELGSPRAEESFLAFQLDLLRESGYLPELGRCAACGRPPDAYTEAFFSADRDAFSPPGLTRSRVVGVPVGSGFG